MTGLTHLSLFTGIGGIDLAAEAAGFETIAQVERDNYCRRVLAKHWPGVPRFDDVRDVTADALRDAGIGRPTLVSGGFPCQPFSCAGKRRGAADDRFLWPEMCRIVSECRPAWVLGENVAGFVGMALDDCAADLERLGYAVRAFVVPAAGVGAPHQRARCFVVANSAGVRREWSAERERRGAAEEGRMLEPVTGCEAVPDAEHDGRHGPEVAGGARTRAGASPRAVGAEQPPRPDRGSRGAARVVHADGERCTERDSPGVAATPGIARRRFDAGGRGWATEPDVGRVAYGVPSRVDRLRALGNAVVPAQVYPFVKAIAEIETTAPATGNAGRPLHA